MELDFRNCKTKEDVEKVFKENQEEISRLKHNLRVTQEAVDRVNERLANLGER